MKFQEIDSELRAGKLRSVYIFHGPERFLMTTSLALIQKILFPDGSSQADRFHVGEKTISQILDILKTSSMFSPAHLLVIDEAEKLKKEDWDLLKGYWKNPVEKSVLVLLATKVGVAVTRENSKAIAVIECKTPYPREIPSWIQMEARRLGVQISQGASAALAEAVGTDLGQISQSVEKLSLYVGDKKLIDLEDVEKVVANTASRTVFEMTNAIGNRKALEATKLIDNLLGQGEAPLKILAMISRHFRILAKAQEGLARGMAERDLAGLLKVNPFFVRDYVSQAKHFRPKDWPARFKILYACDKSLKSSRLSGQQTLEKTIWKLCG